MSFGVVTLPLAEKDIRQTVVYLHERSPDGAASWLAAYDRAIDALADKPLSCAVAEENLEFDTEIRQKLFKTRRGRVYRIVFTVADDEVRILRVRGPGQAPIQPRDTY